MYSAIYNPLNLGKYRTHLLRFKEEIREKFNSIHYRFEIILNMKLLSNRKHKIAFMIDGASSYKIIIQLKFLGLNLKVIVYNRSQISAKS